MAYCMLKRIVGYVKHRFLSSDRRSVLVTPPWATRTQYLDRGASCRALVVSKRVMTEARAFSGFGWKPPQGRRAVR
jgi:hypothetical protein